MTDNQRSTTNPPASLTSLRHLLGVYLFILVAWGFYRLLFRLPEIVEEVLLKPLIWLSPLLYTLGQEKASLSTIGWTTRRLFPSLIWGLGLGAFFVIEGFSFHLLKYGQFSLPQLAPSFYYLLSPLSLVTAVTEETVFRGFLFHRLWQASRKELAANLITNLSWTLIHLPIAIFITKYSLNQLLPYLFLIFLFGVGSSIVFARTKNIASSILLHVLWAWPITLFG